MNKFISFTLFTLLLTLSAQAGIPINTVWVTTNQLIIPYVGIYPTNKPVVLGSYTLPWQQAGKSSNIVATLPANIPAGTYNLTMQGQKPMSVEIGSVTAAAALDDRLNAETARVSAAETVLASDLDAETTRALAAEAGVSNSIATEAARALSAEADLAAHINAISNSIVANADQRILEASNNIVAKLTKNFITAYTFGEQMVPPNSPVVFSSFIGDWTANGTSFNIPADGVYQFSFSVSPDSIDTGSATQMTLHSTDSQNTTTNLLALFKYTFPAPNDVPTLSGQITLKCFQGEKISLRNGPGHTLQLLLPNNTNAPTATLSIIQIQ